MAIRENDVNPTNNSGSLILSNVVQTPGEAINLFAVAANLARWPDLTDPARCLYAVQYLRRFVENAERTVKDLNEQLAECHAKLAEVEPPPEQASPGKPEPAPDKPVK